MNDKEAAIRARLETVLSSILCPVVGCWPLHGCEMAYYLDSGTESYVLEVWPVSDQEVRHNVEDSDDRKLFRGSSDIAWVLLSTLRSMGSPHHLRQTHFGAGHVPARDFHLRFQGRSLCVWVCPAENGPARGSIEHSVRGILG